VIQFAQAVDYYLSPKGQPYIADIHNVAIRQSSEQTDALLLGYAMEGIRLAGTFGSYREAAVADTILEDDRREVPVRPGDRVFVSFVSFQLGFPKSYSRDWHTVTDTFGTGLCCS
jgi:prostaglandin-endoperoxide synthase 1/linoleate 10R-lipoxygenase